MGRGTKKDEIESLLKRLTRHTREVVDQPPDQSSATLGRLLGASFAGLPTQDQSSIGDQIFDVLVSSNINPAVPHAYFDVISSSDSSDVLLECLSRWICRCDELIIQHGSNCYETLFAVIRAYAVISHQQVIKSKSPPSGLDETFHQLKVPASRLSLIRNFVQVATSDIGAVRLLLSPLMAACVLSASSSTEEKSLFLDLLWRECWVKVRSEDHTRYPNEVGDVLLWIQNSLHLFHLSIAGDNDVATSMEIAYQWLLQLVDVIGYMVQLTVLADEFCTFLSSIIELLVRDDLPYFFCGSYRISMSVVVGNLFEILEIPRMTPPRKLETVFRLATLALSTPIKDDGSGITRLLSKCQVSCESNFLIHRMLHTLAYVLGNKDTSRDNLKPIQSQEETPNGYITNMIQLLSKHPTDQQHIVKAITPSLESGSMRLSPLKQNAAFLIGVVFLYKENKESAHNEYLRQLLQQFPHLGITLLPVLMESVQSACRHNNGRELLQWLEYLCDFVVHEPNCAQEVWNLVGVKLLADNTTVLRSSLIRLHPRLCRNNKKLYRRVVDALGFLATSREAEIRLAVAATIAQLAEEDRIRDVSDVIGWIQTFVADENSSVVHYAIMSLHHLVVAQELDYDLVIKVLNKRLCPVTNLSEVLNLPDVCLEALVVLLGDGECDDEEENSDRSEDVSHHPPEVAVVSPQVIGSVQLLIDLLQSPSLSPAAIESKYSKQAIPGIRQNSFKSLANYSLTALGVEEDSVRAALADTEAVGDSLVAEGESRYKVLTKVVLEGMHELTAESEDDSDPLVGLARKLISHEEDVLGHSLWQKGGKVTSSSRDKSRRTRSQKSAIAALPSPAVVRKFYDENPNTATAIASLLCFERDSQRADNDQFGNVTAELSELANDISNESTDPVSLALLVQAWLHSMGSFWSVIENSGNPNHGEILASIVNEIEGWSGALEFADHAYLALSSFSVFIPDEFSASVDRIRDLQMSAYNGHLFENHDIAHICLGLVGARAAFSCSMLHVNAAVGVLLEAVQRPGGRGIGGAYYGLALIAQILPKVHKTSGGSTFSDERSATKLLKEILGALMDTLLSSVEPPEPAFMNLVACIKSGKTSPDLVSSMSSIDESSLRAHENTRHKVKTICLCLALSLPSLRAVSIDLLLASYHFLQALPWGVGKGFTISSAVSSCQSAGLLSEHDVHNLAQRCREELDQAVNEHDGIVAGDALYALASLSQLDSNAVELTMSTLSENDGTGHIGLSVSELVAVTSTLGSVPCLGTGNGIFCEPPQLHSTTTRETAAAASDVLLNISNKSDSSKGAETAIMALAVASSMKSSANYSFHFSNSGAKSDESLSNKEISRIPQANDGTLLSGVLGLIQQCVGSSGDPFVSRLPRLLQSLTKLSLPGQFAKTLLDPIFHNPILDSNGVKAASMELLISQLVSRRRAAFDARDFVKMADRILTLQDSEFVSVLGDGRGPQVFLSAVPKIVLNLPTDSVNKSLEDAWRHCVADTSLNCARLFLEELYALLRTTSATKERGKVQMSPKTMKILRLFVVNNVFTSVRDIVVVAGPHTPEDCRYQSLELLSNCLKEVPLEALDDVGFFKLGDDEIKDAVLRVTCIMLLVRSGYFEENGRRTSEFTKAVAWYARQLTHSSSSHSHALRRVAFEIAFTTKEETAASRHENLLMLLESLVLVKGPNRQLGIEFLAVLLASWIHDAGSDAAFSHAFLFSSPRQSLSSYYKLSESTLESVSEMFLYDLPSKFGRFCRTQRGTATAINRVRRLCKTWAEDEAEPRHVQSLKLMLLCSRDATEKDHQDSSLTTTMLL